MPFGDRPFGAADGIRPHELYRHPPTAAGELHLVDDRGEICAGFLERDVADLAALRRVPAQEVVRVRLVTGADRVLDVRVRAHLAELVVEDCARVLPALGEDVDAVSGLRERADRVVDRLLPRMDRAVVAAETVLRVDAVPAR